MTPTGVKFNPNSNTNWLSTVFNPARQHILDTLKNYGEDDSFGYWLNDMQHRHSNLYNEANKSGNWQDQAYQNDLVGQYQNDYKGTGRFGTYNPKNDYKTDFNHYGIQNAQESNRYDISGPTRTSGDYGNHDYKVDNLYSAITDDRRLLGRKGDWDYSSDEYKKWIEDLNNVGWTMVYDDSDGYYKLLRLPKSAETGKINLRSRVPGVHIENLKKEFWENLKTGLSKKLPDLIAAGRLFGHINNNNRVYDEYIKAVKPIYKDSYHTYRQVQGDEGTKQAYYRRAALGLTQANKYFTSNADRQMAYLMEAKRIGDELRAQGDLVDNQEIRRTSDESNQHLWANIQRDTEVANYNNEARIRSEMEKHKLIAAKKAANWTSKDNALLEKLTELEAKNQKRQLYLDQIFALDEQNKLQNDKKYLDLYQKYNDVYEKANKKYNGNLEKIKLDPDVIKAKRDFENYQYLLKRKLLQAYADYAKQGMKFSFKRKDDLLYKTARDAVDHFRKMAKMSSDTLNRRTPKIEKLTPHPKGTARKMQMGGIAPFTVYRPAAVGGELVTSIGTSSTETKASSGGETKDKNINDVLELFKGLEGLPSDVTVAFNGMKLLLNRLEMFGTELSSSDIQNMYLLQILQISNLKFNKSKHDKAFEQSVANEAISELAVDSYGNFVAQNTDTGEIGLKSWEDIKKGEGKWNPLSNLQLLNIRAYDPNYAGNISLLEIVLNGIGLSKITLYINSIKPTLGTASLTIEGYTKKQSDLIVSGMEVLQLYGRAALVENGTYKGKMVTKSLEENAKYALLYIVSMLPRNMTAILQANADMKNISVKEIIASLLSSELSSTTDVTWDAITGKASANKENSGTSGDTGFNAASALISGKGYSQKMDFNTGSSYAVSVTARYSLLLKHDGENMGAGITLEEATRSTVGGILDWDKASLGGSRIKSMTKDRVIINNGDIAGVDLPVGNDPYIPDFEMLKKLELLDDALLKAGIHEDNPNEWQRVNQMCAKMGIPNKYVGPGKLNTYKWKRFAAIQVTAEDKVLENPSVILDTLGTADDTTRDIYESVMKKKNESYNLSNGIWGKTELYQGTLFIPVREDYVAAALSADENIDMTEATNLTLHQKGYDPAKSSSYKPSQYTLSDLNQ